LLSRTVGFPESGWRAWLFPQGLPCQPGDLSTNMHSPLQPPVYPSLGTPPQLRRNWGSVSPDGPANVSAKSESPFAFSGCYPSKGDVYHHLRGRYPTVFAPTGSCARSIALLSALLHARPSGLCRLLSAPAGHQSFPTLSLHSFPGCLAPYPGGFPRCSCSFLPSEHRPSLSLD